uniref:radical SAM protein n=1 Tax=Eubacterium cellulosolvens TaxID=29322 RepID=UPI0009DF741B|nr:radical SAM protein [[Eubacterium] cellulosolvens]
MPMSSELFNVQEYMTRSMERVIEDAIRASQENPKEGAFLENFAASGRLAAEKRRMAALEGELIPPFLIASITSTCNLRCAGCYSRFFQAGRDRSAVSQLSDEEWTAVFDEAEELGIGFILLAGGEPLLRMGVIEAAGMRPNILFPIFTNGVFMNEKYFGLFERHRNLFPVLSVDGGRRQTDARRGEGMYVRLVENMNELFRRKLFYGVSVMVTAKNLREVTCDKFIDSLRARGCKSVIYVEFIPVDESCGDLSLKEDERETLEYELFRLRETYPDLIFVSFPGDEKRLGGCIAAGRGLFHISSHGAAEPCPFSPYSDVNVKETSIREALKSRLFRMLNQNGLLRDEHEGGCVLHQRKHFVEAVLNYEGE